MAKALTNRINSYYTGLSRLEQKLADYIRGHLDITAQMSILDLAQHAGVSAATVSRFTKKIGYPSFQGLKFAMSQAKISPDSNFFSELSNTDSYHNILVKNFNSNISSLKSTENLISDVDLEKTMTILLKAKSLGFFGLGGSNAVAFIAYHKFMRMPILSVYQHDFHLQLMSAGKMKSTDCAFVISHTGKNRDTLQILNVLQKQKVPVIAITSFAGSPLATLSDVALISISEEISFRPEAVASTVSQIGILDALFMMYGLRTRNRAESSIEDVRRVIKNTRIDGKFE